MGRKSLFLSSLQNVSPLFLPPAYLSLTCFNPLLTFVSLYFYSSVAHLQRCCQGCQYPNSYIMYSVRAF